MTEGQIALSLKLGVCSGQVSELGFLGLEDGQDKINDGCPSGCR
jgi:hypothetical protein